MSRAIDAVLDTNVIVSISRAPTLPPNDKITSIIAKRRLRVCVDTKGGIVGEWESTAKRDVVRQLIVHWQQFKGWKLIEPANALPRLVSRELQRMRFEDAGDKLILRTAWQTTDKRVVSNDPDFWDPKDRKRLGDRSASVAKLCREQLRITVSMLKDTVDELAPTGEAPRRRSAARPRGERR